MDLKTDLVNTCCQIHRSRPTEVPSVSDLGRVSVCLRRSLGFGIRTATGERIKKI